MKYLKILFLIILLSKTISATFISGDIYINEIGEARFNLESNIPLNIEGLTFENDKITGKTNTLTKKEGDIWTLMLVLPMYDNILVDIKLPTNLKELTKISGNENSIDFDNKVISIIDSGKFNFAVSYKLGEKNDYSWLLWSGLLLLVAVTLVVYFRIKRKKQRLNDIMPLINENEQKIIDALMKKSYRQKELRKQLDIPKASFSRYLVNLEKKKLIIREGDGKNKVVRLK